MAIQKKCLICHETKEKSCSLIDELYCKKLSTAVNSLCNKTLPSIENIESKVCLDCAIEVIYVERKVTILKKVFDGIHEKEATSKTTENLETTTVNFNFVCQKCSFSTLELKVFKKHMLQKHEEIMTKPYVCPLCNLSFARHDFYHRHFMASHSACIITENSRPPSVSSEKHALSSKQPQILEPLENGKEIFHCVKCRYTASSSKIFRRHMLNVHKAEKNHVFECSECNKSYQRLDHYRQHIKQEHSTQPDHECTSCYRKFKKLGNLNVHLKTHDSQKELVNQTMLNGAAATSTPLNNKNVQLDDKSIKKPKKRELEDQSLKEEPSEKILKDFDEKRTDVKEYGKSTEETRNSKKKKKVLDKSEEKKKTKFFEKIKDSIDKKETSLSSTIDETMETKNTVSESFFCVFCQKELFSFKKMQKHYAKKHALV